MPGMIEEKNAEGSEALEKTVVRICPACGVVNPAGPSDTCPHLQLARFEGLSTSLADLLAEVADARKTFTQAVAKLKETVKSSVRTHEAEIEATQSARSSQVEQLAPPMASDAPALALESPPLPKPRKPAKRRKKRVPLPVNPKQLELIARAPAKGDA